MPSETRRGDWMQTYTGRRFWPLDPRPEGLSINDIAHALSLICRYGGHAKRFYSVAEHCVLAAVDLRTRGAAQPTVQPSVEEVARVIFDSERAGWTETERDASWKAAVRLDREHDASPWHTQARAILELIGGRTEAEVKAEALEEARDLFLEGTTHPLAQSWRDGLIEPWEVLTERAAAIRAGETGE